MRKKMKVYFYLMKSLGIEGLQEIVIKNCYYHLILKISKLLFIKAQNFID